MNKRIWIEKRAAQMAFEDKAEPVERFENILITKGFEQTNPGAIADNTFVRERGFYDAENNEGYIFDFAVFGRSHHNFYVELNGADHRKPDRRARDKKKAKAANKRGIAVLTLEYDFIENLDDDQIWGRIRALLHGGSKNA